MPPGFVAAPNSFKGSLSATLAARAIAEGIRRVFPDAEVLEIPLADGGEGTTEALVRARNGSFVEVVVEGPFGTPIPARLGLIDDGATAVAELAETSGLTLISPQSRDPRHASTRGFGQLLDACRKEGVQRIIVGLGGSATNDGGAGLAQAIGYRLLDGKGVELEAGGSVLAHLDRIDGSGVNPAWREIEVLVAADVTNPLVGPSGASLVYSRQKGADAAVAAELDDALTRLAAVVRRDLGVDMSNDPGSGAGGGVGGGLKAFVGARLISGAKLVADMLGFDTKIAGASAIFTGEGSVDSQTTYGKAPMEVIRRAQLAGTPVIVLAGSLGQGWEAVMEHGALCILPIAEGPVTLEEMTRDASGLVERAAVRACRLLAADTSLSRGGVAPHGED